MEILIIAVLIGLIPAAIASNKGHSFFGWWVFGALLFIIALPLAIIQKPKTAVLEAKQFGEGMRKCPHCAEMIKREANVCRYCGRESEAWNLHGGKWWITRPDASYWLDEKQNAWMRREAS